MDFSSKTAGLLSYYKIAPRPQMCTPSLIHKLIKITDLEAFWEKFKKNGTDKSNLSLLLGQQ